MVNRIRETKKRTQKQLQTFKAIFRSVTVYDKPIYQINAI